MTDKHDTEDHPEKCSCYKCSDPDPGYHERRSMERSRSNKSEPGHPRTKDPRKHSRWG